MAQRVATAAVLIVFLIVMMYFGGVVMGIGAMVCLCFAMHEEYHALSVAGHRPVAWPTWVATAACVPLVAAWGIGTVIPLLAMTCLITIICVVFRDEPKLEDAVMSVLPLFTVMLPGMCIVVMAQVQPKAVQVVLLSLTFAVPVLGDTLAFFVGSRVRGPKLCPAVSPNKTISGAIAGLVGSLLAAAVVVSGESAVLRRGDAGAAAQLVAVCADRFDRRRCGADGRSLCIPREAPLWFEGLLQSLPRSRRYARPSGQHPLHGCRHVQLSTAERRGNLRGCEGFWGGGGFSERSPSSPDPFSRRAAGVWRGCFCIVGSA